MQTFQSYLERMPVKCDKCDNTVLYLTEVVNDGEISFAIFACPICGKRFIVEGSKEDNIHGKKQ